MAENIQTYRHMFYEQPFADYALSHPLSKVFSIHLFESQIPITKYHHAPMTRVEQKVYK